MNTQQVELTEEEKDKIYKDSGADYILSFKVINQLLTDRFNKGKEEGIAKYNEANEFIKSIAKLLGEDDLGYDGKNWTIEDFENAINNLTPNQ